jgi:hypothetical protein
MSSLAEIKKNRREKLKMKQAEEREERMAEMHKSLPHRRRMLYDDIIEKFNLKE